MRRALIAILLLADVALAEEPPSMEELVVIGGRIEQRLAEVPTHTTVVGGDEIRRSAARRIDDLLRFVPGFSLFRRSSSRATHPTTQGVTLRGVAPSGVSRTLVLLDGLPLNDPFGGWVQWSRVPREGLERIEISRGGGSSVWGSSALAGTIHLVTERPEERTLAGSIAGGSRGTIDAEALAADSLGGFDVSLGGSFFDTSGYEVVREDQRGPIDVDADAENASFRGRLGRPLSDSARLSLGGSVFREERGNGTPLTENETDVSTIDARLEMETEGRGRLDALAWGQLQTFESTFSSQEADRSAESPALDQFDVPSEAFGVSLAWSRRIGGAHHVLAGFDARRVTGETNESFFFAGGAFQNRRVAGAEEELYGLYVQDVVALAPRLELTLGARVDLWRTLDGFRHERNLATGEIRRDETFENRDDVTASPKVGLRYAATGAFSLRGAFYQAFRSPTINELVRPFRVRNDITEANAGLDPERLTGGEVGVDHSGGRHLVRATGFWNEVRDPIGNVTIASGPGLVAPCGFVPEGGVCRQRQNLGKTRILGVELEVVARLGEHFAASLSGLVSDAEVRRATGAPDLEGRDLAQVPEASAAIRLDYANPALLDLAVQGRWIGDQFEDDRNELELGDFFVLDVYLARRLTSEIELFVGLENALGRVFEAGRTADGLVTIGAPRLVQGGVRIRL